MSLQTLNIFEKKAINFCILYAKKYAVLKKSTLLTVVASD